MACKSDSVEKYKWRRHGSRLLQVKLCEAYRICRGVRGLDFVLSRREIRMPWIDPVTTVHIWLIGDFASNGWPPSRSAACSRCTIWPRSPPPEIPPTRRSAWACCTPRYRPAARRCSPMRNRKPPACNRWNRMWNRPASSSSVKARISARPAPVVVHRLLTAGTSGARSAWPCAWPNADASEQSQLLADAELNRMAHKSYFLQLGDNNGTC